MCATIPPKNISVFTVAYLTCFEIIKSVTEDGAGITAQGAGRQQSLFRRHTRERFESTHGSALAFRACHTRHQRFESTHGSVFQCKKERNAHTQHTQHTQHTTTHIAIVIKKRERNKEERETSEMREREREERGAVKRERERYERAKKGDKDEKKER